MVRIDILQRQIKNSGPDPHMQRNRIANAFTYIGALLLGIAVVAILVIIIQKILLKQERAARQAEERQRHRIQQLRNLRDQQCYKDKEIVGKNYIYQNSDNEIALSFGNISGNNICVQLSVKSIQNNQQQIQCKENLGMQINCEKSQSVTRQSSFKQKDNIQIIQQNSPQTQRQQSYNQFEECNICLENFQSGDDIKEVICNHKFHQHCIKQWVQKGNLSCPTCREKLYFQLNGR